LKGNSLQEAFVSSFRFAQINVASVASVTGCFCGRRCGADWQSAIRLVDNRRYDSGTLSVHCMFFENSLIRLDFLQKKMFENASIKHD
jgi:hypothetical protein